MVSLPLPLLLLHSLDQTDWENEVAQQEHRKDWEMKAFLLPPLRFPGQMDSVKAASVLVLELIGQQEAPLLSSSFLPLFSSSLPPLFSSFLPPPFFFSPPLVKTHLQQNPLLLHTKKSLLRSLCKKIKEDELSRVTTSLRPVLADRTSASACQHFSAVTGGTHRSLAMNT